MSSEPEKKSIRLIGRDNLLKREIYPRLKVKKPFYLVGQRGVGKSAILEWAFNAYEGNKIYVAAGESYGQIVKEIARVQKLDMSGRKVVAELEKELLKGEPVALFLDEIERLTPKIIRMLKALNEFWPLYMSGIAPFRDELKVILWGKPEIKIHPIEKLYRRQLAELCIKDTGSLTDMNTMIQMSRGIPARCWAIARGEVLKNDHERVDGEEINIAPMLFLVLVVIIIMRYIGKETNDHALYLIGSILMGLAVLFRMMIYNVMRKS